MPVRKEIKSMTDKKALDKNEQFLNALHFMENTNHNLFITGKAGTGKSTLLDYFFHNTDKNPVILAPTGVAALNVKGQTIHRFFNFYIDVTPEKIIKKQIRPRDPKLYKNIKTIIIDEVSMLRADILDCIDVFLRIYGPDETQSFGGIQMIFVGDLYQLPPVVSRDEREIFRTHYGTPYFFSAQALQDDNLEIIELENVYRQKDQTFVNLLNKIRNNSVDHNDLTLLNERYNAPQVTDDNNETLAISLTTTNAKADDINDQHLNALDNQIHCSRAVIKGDFGKEYYPTATDLTYKIGAQIMLLNNDNKKRWVNGSIGIIESVNKNEDGEEYLRVRLHDTHKAVSVFAHTWEVYKFTVKDGAIVTEPAGSFTQYPFRLAWAVTIHKSQGKTFDHVIIDIGRGAFASGQTYVALSRCTSFEGVSLKVPIQKKDIQTDPRIYKFLTHYAYRKAAEHLSLDDKMEIIAQAIKNSEEIEITYLKANDSKSTQIITPIRAGNENYHGKIFPGMLAQIKTPSEERMFHVGRILDIKKIQNSH